MRIGLSRSQKLWVKVVKDIKTPTLNAPALEIAIHHFNIIFIYEFKIISNIGIQGDALPGTKEEVFFGVVASIDKIDDLFLDVCHQK
ncbi:hypothetical protein ABW07_21210 [Pluralibacter gergoviae]|nr:hypothetical protein ABW07_21210 [Pluralibacter gergoviae]